MPASLHAVVKNISVILTVHGINVRKLRRIDYFNGETLIASMRGSPWNLIWNNVPLGVYSDIYAIVIDNRDHIFKTLPVSFTIGETEIPNPTPDPIPIPDPPPEEPPDIDPDPEPPPPPPPPPPPDPEPPEPELEDLPLLQLENFIYDNSFIAQNHNVGLYTFSSGRYALMYKPSTDSFIMMGGVVVIIDGTSRKTLGEISNRPTNNTNLSALINSHQERFGADWSLASGGSNSDFRFGGNLIHNGRLITTAYNKYRAAGTTSNRPAFFVSDENLSVAGYTGPWIPYPILGLPGGTAKTDYVNGSMGHIPPEWQAAFGGPCFVTNYGMSTVGRCSAGHTFGVFNPDDIGVIDPFPITMCRYVPTTADMVGSSWTGAPTTLFNALTFNHGAQFIPGTRTIVFSQTQGTGTPQYFGGGYQNTGGIYAWILNLYDALDMLKGLNDTIAKPAIQPYASIEIVAARPHINNYECVRGLAMDTVNNPSGTIARLYSETHLQGVQTARIHALNVVL